jgi:hypothetical protein
MDGPRPSRSIIDNRRTIAKATPPEAETSATAAFAFASNDAITNEHSTKGLSYWLGHNEFSDMTWEEISPSTSATPP